jgi:hypothetical protein
MGVGIGTGEWGMGIWRFLARLGEAGLGWARLGVGDAHILYITGLWIYTMNEDEDMIMMMMLTGLRIWSCGSCFCFCFRVRSR